jgi:hypothetical protein
VSARLHELRYSVTSWIRWHLPVSREAALRLAEQEGACTFDYLLGRIRRLEEMVVVFTDVPGDRLPDNRGAELRAEIERQAAQIEARERAGAPRGYPPARRRWLHVAGGPR